MQINKNFYILSFDLNFLNFPCVNLLSLSLYSFTWSNSLSDSSNFSLFSLVWFCLYSNSLIVLAKFSCKTAFSALNSLFSFNKFSLFYSICNQFFNVKELCVKTKSVTKSWNFGPSFNLFYNIQGILCYSKLVTNFLQPIF